MDNGSPGTVDPTADYNGVEVQSDIYAFIIECIILCNILTGCQERIRQRNCPIQ